MKKQFQILGIAITIVFFSCGRHNAEITNTFKTGMKEFAVNSFLPVNEPDLLLMDNEGRIRFNAELVDGEKEFFILPGTRTSLTFDEDDAPAPAISSLSYSVN